MSLADIGLAEQSPARFVVRKRKAERYIVEAETGRIVYRAAAAATNELEAVAGAFSQRPPVEGEILRFETRRPCGKPIGGSK